MAFDWTAFFDSYHVRYVTAGPNVSRGHINVKCPWCGLADPSEHMSINLAGRGWRCYRSQDHRGKNASRLVAALIGVTITQAKQIVGEAVFLPEDFMAAVMSKMQPAAVIKRKPLKLPDEFKPISLMAFGARRFVEYLIDGRGFDDGQVSTMSKRYDLHYATSGPQRGRIIFPLYMDGRLVTWTGRTIYDRETLRYRTLSSDPDRETEPAMGPITEYLLWYDDLRESNADTLVLCEGPFDALKVAVLGYQHGIDATCCTTAAPSETQIELLHEIAPRYRRRILLLDRGTWGTSLKLSTELAALKMQPIMLPSRLKDPGEMRASDVRPILLEA